MDDVIPQVQPVRTGGPTTRFNEPDTLVDEIKSKNAAQQSGFDEAAQQFEVKVHVGFRKHLNDATRCAKEWLLSAWSTASSAPSTPPTPANSPPGFSPPR